MFHVKHKKGSDENVKNIFVIILLMFNLVVIICQWAKINELYEEIYNLTNESIKEINNLRKKD